MLIKLQQVNTLHIYTLANYILLILLINILLQSNNGECVLIFISFIDLFVLLVLGLLVLVLYLFGLDCLIDCFL